MRARLELFARRWWAGDFGAAGRLLAALTLPLSWAWWGTSAIAARRQDVADPDRVDGLTVISVGNLAVGGTGKTPLVGWTAATLLGVGVAPAILVGAHGRDEALLHRRRALGVPVVVQRDRVAGARRALADGATVAILDDGFQHRRLHRDLDVVLLAAEDAFPGRLLPRGPYRERPSALARADLVVVTRRTASLETSRRLRERVEALCSERVLAGMELAGAAWTDLDGAAAAGPEGDVIAACGVGRADAFRSTVARRVTGSVELVAFADHHEYTPADVRRLRTRAAGRPIVITEKDAVKVCAYFGEMGESYVLTEEVRWDWGEDAFVARLRTVIAGGPQA